MEEKDYIEEKDIGDYSKSISHSTMKMLFIILERSICKINCNDGSHGTGFFCVIPFLNDWDTLRVLITNEHVLKENDILPGKIIKLSLNDERKNIEIIIDESRKTYISQKYDITMIEIKKDDGLNKDSFLEIDKKIFDENLYIRNIFKKSMFIYYIILKEEKRIFLQE